MIFFKHLNNKFNLSQNKSTPYLSKPQNNSSLEFKNVVQDSKNFILHDKIPVSYKDGNGYLETYIEPIPDAKDSVWFISKIADKENKTLGSYNYQVNLTSKKIGSGYIHTVGQYRHKGIGEIMRLASLMELKENNINAIEINALPEAIQFHHNYKFKPNITQRFWAIKILQNICKNPNIQENHRQKADSLCQHISEKTNWLLDKKKAKSVNYFIENILKTYKSNWQTAGLSLTIPMILTKNNMNKFSSFFNDLFKKHGINYKI